MDINPLQPPLFNSSALYNATYKLATRFLGIPSRVIARMRRIDEILDPHIHIDEFPSPASLSLSLTSLANGYATPAPSLDGVRSGRVRGTGTGITGASRGGNSVSIPGPWGFLTSGYFVGLFFMAFLINRVQNIVVPPRHPVLYHNRRHTRGLSSSRGRLGFYMNLLPIDPSSTFSRFAFRVPSIYLLGKTLLIWTIALLQAAELYPSKDWSLAQRLGSWVAGKTMEEICWFTFTSVCVTLFVGALTNGLEGNNSTNQTPFNLFAYSFILYIYASPAMHVKQSLDGGNTRPDKQIIVTLILPLASLMMTHCMEVKQKWARMRLVPTTIIGVLSLVHFHAVMWFFPSPYPLPNYIPNVVESILAFVTFTTCTLNALTQLLLTGAITKPLFGHTESLMPKWDEDFTVVMFRLGTASLEATNVAGLGNEVGWVSALPGTLSRHSTEEHQGTIELHRSGSISYSEPILPNGRKAKRGFANEITRIKTGTQSDATSGYMIDCVANSAWRRELARFGKTLWKTLKGLWILLRHGPRRRSASEGQALEDSRFGQGVASDAHEDDHEADYYSRFLRGEAVSDDEDDDAEFNPRSRSPSSSYPPDISEADSDEGEEEEEEQEITDDGIGGSEAVSLYADLSLTASDTASAPVLLAHMTSTSSSPLTRRRYSRLVSGTYLTRSREDEGEGWDEYVLERREAKAWRRNEGEDDSTRRNCVVCTVEPRQIICWPCRCLALCDDCRENMASRSAASKHSCPCCRQSVEGYSKIYIP
ncbi:hypothetical protein BXZ70DRAFT_942746 [Cristinia sonorae]|uniref:RING-type domain-containing protein n=1 Tax=Cristinia sonorae TaxID=1940300 RepID=A0A8K0ULQ9_9AGAR|nr:hypothetical protein BXZ70DRAFT_942746 [Cristinia sonorae]